MNKNTLTGLFLIGLILVGFTMYNENQMSAYKEAKAKADSITNIQKQIELKELASLKPYIDSVEQVHTIAYLSPEMAIAAQGTEKIYTLENDRIIAKISNKGGAIKSVELKDYQTFSKEPLFLFKEKNSKFNLSFFTDKITNTSNFFFNNQSGDVIVKNEGDSQSMIMTLQLSATASIDYIYTITEGSNMVDFKIKLNNAETILSPNQNSISLDWSNVSPQQERGFSYENTYTTVAYMYPNESSMEELSFSDGTEREEVESSVKWIAFKQQFFSSILIANESFSDVVVGFETMGAKSGDIKHFSTKVSLPYTAGTTKEYGFNFYFGPNKYSELKEYDNNLDEIVPLGWGVFNWVNRFIVIPAFNFLGEYISNYGLVILLLTIYIKVLLFGFTYKSYVSMAKMRILKPDIDKLTEKYPNKEDAMKKQQATMELYSKAGVNPMGGCIPMLFQMPILFAMFKFFPASIELRGQSFLWVNDLSSYDSILNLPFDIPMYGSHVSLFALLMGLSVVVSSKMNMQNGPSTQQTVPGMQFMMTYVMPIMLVVVFNSYASGLSYYYILFNLFTIVQTVIIRKFVDDDKLHAQMKANAKKPNKKSKWASKYEEMAKKQKEIQEQQNKGK